MTDDGFSALQNVMWKTAALIETVGLFVFASRATGLDDPVVAAIWSGIALLGIWLTRRWVRTSWPDEKIRALARRRK
jgi:hypothetical protein